LNFKGKMSFSTITAPGVVIPEKFLRDWDRHVAWFQDQLAKMGAPALRTTYILNVPAKSADIRSFGQVRNHEVPGMWCPPTGKIMKCVLG
jgi:hypothetical protein